MSESNKTIKNKEEIEEFNLTVYEDNRGFFYEAYSKTLSDSINIQFKQDSVSYSKKGVVRGLHYQWEEPMGKLVQVINGRIIDYAVDIRTSSPSYGKYWSYELSKENRKCIWIPPGYAHGFEAIEDSVVLYKCSAYYNPDAEGAINFYDEAFGIKTYFSLDRAIISEKDRTACSFFEYSKNPRFLWETQDK